MKRKVTLHGPATLSVSLPLKWARRFNVKKGDELEVIEQQDYLLVSPGTINKEKKEINISIPKMEARSILFLIRTLYINGYDTIHLKFESDVAYHSRRKIKMTMMNLISTELNRLMGFEVVEVGQKSCTIKCLSKESTEEFEVALKRAFTILNVSLKEIEKALTIKHSKLEQFGEDIHTQVTRLIAYNLRTLSKIGYKNNETLLKMYNILFKVDDFLDHIKYWLREIDSYVPMSNKKILDITSKFNDYFGKCFELFYKFNLESYSKLFEDNYSIRNSIVEIKTSLSIKEKRYLLHLEKMLEELLKLNIARISLEY